MQNGQSAHAILEFWGGGWWGQYLISSHVTEYVTMSSAQDEWIELSTAAVAPDDAINTHVAVVFSNPTEPKVLYSLTIWPIEEMFIMKMQTFTMEESLRLWLMVAP